MLWAKRTGSFDPSFPASGICETAPGGCPDPHDVNNRYEWSSTGGTGTEPDGNAYTDFLEKLQDPFFGSAAAATEVTGCFAGRCDWRLPNIVEISTILDCSFGNRCIDPLFGPTASSRYWSASSSATSPNVAWFADFNDGFVGNDFDGIKTFDVFVRAVRAGSCN